MPDSQKAAKQKDAELYTQPFIATDQIRSLKAFLLLRYFSSTFPSSGMSYESGEQTVHHCLKAEAGSAMEEALQSPNPHTAFIKTTEK